MLQDREEDKYNFKGEAKIDCENRVQFCHPICCRLRFALSKQDVYEGVIKWDLGGHPSSPRTRTGTAPTLSVARAAAQYRSNDRYHAEATLAGTTTHLARFENKIANPNIDRPDWPDCEIENSAEGNGKPA